MVFGRVIAVLIVMLGITDPGFAPLVPENEPGSAFERVGIGADGVAFLGREIRLTGTTRGYLATKSTYTDFRLRLTWRFEVPSGADRDGFDGNSGVLIRIGGPAKVWPDCLEVQISPDDPGAFFALGGGFVGRVDLDARRRAERAPGEWNEVEIEAKGDRVISRLNGETVATGTYKRRAGPIGFQSQAGTIRFRDVRIEAASN